MSPIHSKDIDELFEIILSLHTKEECYRFFNDLCTIREIKDMALRVQVAKMLINDASYQKVSEQLNVSSATVSRVKKCVDYGDGYTMVLKKKE